MHAGHVKWSDGDGVPAVVYWLNSAYRCGLRKAKIEARAFRRAGLDPDADALLLQAVEDKESEVELLAA
ncbi:hypothetical protein [Streptosporangium roseum]|uniref:hypothetical protein n=1 Tax=Streptosporangium roseum TaxID=2001 RepID=UPI00331C9BA2